ncbi:hypothetical protein IOC61_13680 [Halomonas sp. KAO]|nr:MULTISPECIES: hypothetical protein [unclassified Halomonas]MBF7054351.1 hypothetical protein [Halomonas sp. KAO]MDT0499900.1 hypothetical protein [Halomonas sp. PAR7]MDT0512305.1 hypothetical protein [Halomonas sp. LES1]MDT0590938.1 hypothetical protein [Halomonas sp. PAR8]
MEGLAAFPANDTLPGMMIIGMTLGRVSIRELDGRFTEACVAIRVAIRCALWPLLALGAAPQLIPHYLGLMLPLVAG